ncbi:MAG: THUMP domain-containing protein, partial [Pseudomonadota bacterium]|nr:THUMP domain-containing protein [Pseudomonadota bacterium]
MFKFIVKLHPEISIKSKSVRKRFTKLLASNVKNMVIRVHEDAKVIQNWDNIVVMCKSQDEEVRLGLIDTLKRVPGIVQFIEVQETTFESLDDIYQVALELNKERLKGKTFCVRCKRQGKHDFTSSDVERYVGGGLNQNVEGAQVKLQ